jgi:hypothetical protein
LIALQRKGPAKGPPPAFIGIRHSSASPVGAKDETSWLLRPRMTVFITDDNDAA